ncbi:LysR family transcriptional regulator [Burkholderia sp. AU19243]|uniref:LysR substrate-binding domain-containing protein n=1 Tax=Burkholderia TaxID=32008 RepID=UPI0008420D6A|nr:MULTISPECIES: LysR substrate-binding domain-containing protein [Burkholderia]MBR8143011.1 LysR family transcriptional regulator [Burkholderia vietnamiensis]AOK04382.1 LysR family transcriptional regulator [Burkholderia latens]MBR8364159.1 LysR family transcriptional regulator [Burkholderia sp. AU19243]MBY4694488.1 LysR family transcriptional regulator [Burkholderia latens]MCA8309446.1 LysR family transcriptional regulator [Burkholderia sp. AU28942]
MTAFLHGLALRYFVEVARTGSISDASARLHVAVSAISRQIAKLESELGAPLFERRPRGMALSEAGERLLGFAQRSLLEAEHVMKEIGGLEALHGSLLKIACSEGFAIDFLPGALASFKARHPGVDFTVWVVSPADATRRVRDGDADIALTFSLAPEQGVRVEHAERAPIFALVRRDHPLAARDAVSLADIAGHPHVLPEAGTTVRQLIDIACVLDGLMLEPELTSNNTAVMYRYAQRTGAVMFTGLLSVRDRIDADGFVVVPVTNPQLRERSIQVQTMAGRDLPASVRAFRDHLVDAMRAASAPPVAARGPGRPGVR